MSCLGKRLLTLVLVITQHIVYKQSYRQSLKQEKEEMENSLVILRKQSTEDRARETLYENYLENVIAVGFIQKMQSKK